MRISDLRRLSLSGFALIALFGLTHTGRADETTFTRVYQLKNIEASSCIRAIDFAVPDVSKKRILSGQGKKLVVTDIAGNQDEIAMLLPVVDQVGKETDPRRAAVEVTVRVVNYLNHKKKSTVAAASPSAAPGAPATRNVESGVAKTFDTRYSTVPYKSVYSDEDEKLTKGPRVIREDPVLPAVSNLTLKGIFMASSKRPIALLTFANSNFTARDGGLYYFNRTPMKGYTSQVLKDRVIITGPDRTPREIKFKTTL